MKKLHFSISNTWIGWKTGVP